KYFSSRLRSDSSNTVRRYLVSLRTDPVRVKLSTPNHSASRGTSNGGVLEDSSIVTSQPFSKSLATLSAIGGSRGISMYFVGGSSSLDPRNAITSPVSSSTETSSSSSASFIALLQARA